MLIPALQKDKALIADVELAKKDTSRYHIWWLGQSGFLLQWKGRHLLLDPYLSDSLTVKYAATDKPHIRMSERVVDPSLLDFVDVVTSSHNHTDHLDADTLMPLIRANPGIQLVIPEANRSFVCDRIGQSTDFPVGLSDGKSTEIAGFRLTGIPAAHNELERDENGNCRYMGYIIQFGDWIVYHSGDTLWHPEIVRALEPFSIDLAFLPINGNKPERKVAGNLNATEAVALARQLKIRMVIPCHYDMFTFNTVTPDEFCKLAAEQGVNHTIMQGGQRWSANCE